MDRRDILKYTALLMGASLSSGTIAAILSGCHVNDSVDWMPLFLTDDEAVFISELGETILPATATPGAKDAMVAKFIDTIRPLRYTDEENNAFKNNLKLFMDQARTEMGNDFVKVSADKRLAWVTEVDKLSYAQIKSQEDLPQEQRPFYLALKEQIIAGYFSSEIVAKQYFLYDPVPGEYAGCIPFSEVGKAWAL